MVLAAGTFIALVVVLGLPLLVRDAWFSLPFAAIPGVGLGWLALPRVTPDLPRWQRVVIWAEAGVVFVVAGLLAVVGVVEP